MTPPHEDFVPPGAEQVRTHLDRYGPVARDPWRAWRPILLLTVALIVSATVDTWWAQVLPWAMMAVVMVLVTSPARRAHHLAMQLAELQEYVMLRQYVPALRMAWRVLPKMAAIPAFHDRTIAFMAHGLDQVGSYNAAIATYDYMIDRLPKSHPGAVQMRIARSIAHLNNGQLADADIGLRGVRRQVEGKPYPPIQATFRFACLLQQVRTNHFADAVETAATLQEGLRPLGIEAGYGHALMALAFHMQQAAPPGVAREEGAETWWSRATMLLPAGVLTSRFPELAVVDDAYASAPPLASVSSVVTEGITT